MNPAKIDELNSDTYKFGDFRLSPDKRLLMRDGVSLRLSTRLMDALILLVNNHGKVVTKDEFLKQLWPDSFVEENNLNQAISALRKSLGMQSNGSDFIETVPKVGYRFIAPVERHHEQHSTYLATPVVRSSSRLLFGSAVLLVALLVVGSAFVLRRRKSESIGDHLDAKSGLTRLTTFDGDEQAAEFTRDGRIRFARRIDKIGYSFQMNADGSNVSRDTSIPGLQVGRWSPDGSKVFYYKEGDPNVAYLANVDGSNVKLLPFQFGNAMWSPDSRKFLFQTSTLSKEKNNSDIYIYDLESQKTEPVIVSSAFDGDPSFDPDGQHILFVSDRDGNIEIYSKDLINGSLVRLTNNPAHDAFPTFSPDGTQIVFTSNREKENFDVYIMNADGGDVRKLTDSPGDDSAVTNPWSTDGTKILFFSDRDGGQDNIYVLNVEPSQPRLLISDVNMDVTSPSYSPDGSQLLVETKNGGGKASIALFSFFDQKLRNVSETFETNSLPVFSPDAKRIVFRDKVDGNSDIFVMNDDGTGRTNISANPAADSSPVWSPDGKQIVFVSNREGDLSAYGLIAMNADGSNQHVVYYAHSFVGHPRFTPDGKSLVFEDDKFDGRTGNFELLMVNLDKGKEEKRLTFRPKYDAVPAVSPDGQWIAFTSNTDGNSEIYVMRIDGSGLVRLTRNLANDSSPAWSPDGKRIVFASNRSGKFAIYEVKLD